MLNMNTYYVSVWGNMVLHCEVICFGVTAMHAVESAMEIGQITAPPGEADILVRSDKTPGVTYCIPARFA